MFDFAVSPQLVRRAINDLPGLGSLVVRYKLWSMGHRADELAPHWGKHVVSAISVVVQRTRHLIRESATPDHFVIIKDGTFDKEIADCIEQYTCFIGADRPLMQEVAKELLAHFRTAGLPQLHPRAPITSFELEGNTLSAHLRPYVPRAPNPNWVRATTVK